MQDNRPLLLITVHGIRTFGHWQHRLGTMVKLALPECVVENFSYGYFSIFAFLIPPFRWFAIRLFKHNLLEAANRYPNHRITLVGHSNGTYLIGWALQQSQSALLNRIDTVILAGSVLRTSFPWNSLIDRLKIKRVINDCGINDGIVALSQMTVLFTGSAGRFGFIGMLGDRLKNRYFVGGHSLYFEERSVPSDEFMKKYWLPLVLGLPGEQVDMRKSSGPMQGAYIWLLQNAELLKGLVYGLTLYLIINHGFLEPRRIANVEAIQHAKEIAATTFSGESFPEIGVAKLIEAIKRDNNKVASPLFKVLEYHLPRFVNLDEVTKEENIYLVKSTEARNYIRWQGQLKKLKAHPTSKVWATPQGHIIEITADKILHAYDVDDLLAPVMSLDLKDLKATRVPTTEALVEADVKKRPLAAPLELRLGIGAETWAQFIPTNAQGDVTLYFDEAVVKPVDRENEPSNSRELPNALAAIIKVDVRSKRIKAYAFDLALMSTDCRSMAIGQYVEKGFSPEKKSKTSRSGLLNDKNTLYYSVLDLNNVPFEGVKPRIVKISSEENKEWIDLDSANSGCYKRSNLPQRRHGEPELVIFPSYLQEIHMWDYMGPHPEGTREQEALEFLDDSNRLNLVTKALEIYEKAPGIVTDKNTNEIPGNLQESSDPCAKISEFINQPKAAACTIISMLDAGDKSGDLFRKLKAEDPENPFITKEQVDYITRGESYWTNVRVKRLPMNEFILIDETPPVNFGLTSLVICRLSAKIERTSCMGRSSSTYGDSAAISSDARYALGREENGIGNGHVLIDIEKLETIEVEQIAEGYFLVGRAFSSNSKKYAVLGAQGDILIGSLPSGTVTLRLHMSQSTFTEPEHTYVLGARYTALQFYKNYLIMRLAAGNVFAIDDTTGKILWFSHSLGNIGTGENLRIKVSETDGVAFVHDEHYGRFLSPETGIWLSGEISAGKLYASNKEACDKQRNTDNANDRQETEKFSEEQPIRFQEVNLIASGSVAVKVEGCWFIRRPPLRMANFEDTFGHVNQLIGNIKTDNAIE